MYISKFTHCRNFILIICLTSPAFALAQAQVPKPIGKVFVEWLEKKVMPYFEGLEKKVMPYLEGLEKEVIEPGLKWLDGEISIPGGKWLREQVKDYTLGKIIEWSYERCKEWINPQVNSESGQSENDNLSPYKAAFIILVCVGVATLWLLKFLIGYIKRKTGKSLPQ